MKCKLLYFTMIVAILSLGISSSGCARKSGCPAYESAVSKPNKKGNYKKAKSGLFDKETQKRMAKKS